jgi:L-fucose isomerase-like protein
MALHQIQSKSAVKAAKLRRAKPAPPPPPRAKLSLGLLVGSRGFFPGHLANTGREEMTARLEKAGYDVIVLSPDDTTHGAVQTRADAKKCAALFKSHRDKIAGVIVTLPNFGDEAAIGDTLRLAGLDVPVLVHAWGDETKKMGIAHRRDSFCGKMSACNVLTQYGIPYSLTSLHTEHPDSPDFTRDLEWFAGVCRVVRGLRTARIGAIGARPAAFKTVRYSEKILEASGIAVEPIDLSEILGRVDRLRDHDLSTQRKWSR